MGLLPPEPGMDLGGLPPLEGGDMMAMDLGMPPVPGMGEIYSEPDMGFGAPPGLDLAAPPAVGGDMMAMDAGMDLGLPPAPGADFGMGMDMTASAPPLPGVTTGGSALRLDLPKMPSDVPLMTDPVQDLPTLNSNGQTPKV